MEIIHHTRGDTAYAIEVPQAVINAGRDDIPAYVDAQIDALTALARLTDTLHEDVTHAAA